MSTGVKLLITGIVITGISFILPIVGVLHFVLGSPSIQFEVPGKKQITLESAGKYILYNDYITTYGDKNYRTGKQLPDGMAVEILTDYDNKKVDFKFDSSTTTQVMGTKSISVGSFEVTKPCKVEINVSGLEENRIFSISDFKLTKILILVGASVLTVSIGVVLLIIGIVKIISSQVRKNISPAAS